MSEQQPSLMTTNQKQGKLKMANLKRAATALLVLAAFHGHGQDDAKSVFDVPSGTDFLPVIGEVTCLEPQDTSRTCSVEYNCDENGWLAADGEKSIADGNKLTLQHDHDVFGGNNCQILVDGKADAKWFRVLLESNERSYVGLVDFPVIETASEDAAGSMHGNALDYFLNEYSTTLEEQKELVCGDVPISRYSNVRDRHYCESKIVSAGRSAISRSVDDTLVCFNEALSSFIDTGLTTELCGIGGGGIDAQQCRNNVNHTDFVRVLLRVYHSRQTDAIGVFTQGYRRRFGFRCRERAQNELRAAGVYR